MIDRDLKIENEKFRQLMTMAKLGWWEADFTSREYVCSDFVADLLGLEGDNTISFYAFQGLIRRDYRVRISNEFLSKIRKYMNKLFLSLLNMVKYGCTPNLIRRKRIWTGMLRHLAFCNV